MDINRENTLTREVEQVVDQRFSYQQVTAEQKARGEAVKASLAAATKVIIANVPPCADRTVALRKLLEASFDSLYAITHDGKY